MQGTKSSPADANAKKNAFAQLVSALGSNSFLQAGLSAAPYVGTAVSVLDAFFGGGKEESGPQQVSLQPMTLEMTTKMTGTLDAKALFSTITFNNPGTRLLNTPEEYPYYNEALGVFSLVRKPVVEVVTEPVYDGLRIGRHTEYHIVNDLQYALNPASGLEVQDFQVALLQEGSKYPNPMPSGWIYEGLANKGGTSEVHVLRTDYLKSGCLTNQSFTLDIDDIKSQFPHTVSDEKIFLKFILNLRAAPNPQVLSSPQNVLVVLKYPITLRKVNSLTIDYNQPCRDVAPPLSELALQSFCNSTTYAGAVQLRPAGSAGLPSAAHLAAPLLDDVQVYPNPAATAALVRLSSVREGQATVYLTDAVGRRVAAPVAVPVAAGGQEQRLDVSGLAPGLYHCVVESSDGRRTTRLLHVAR